MSKKGSTCAHSVLVVGLLLVFPFMLDRAWANPQSAKYANNAAGLEKLIATVLATVSSGQTDAAAAQLRSLALPNPDNWFRENLGDAVGTKLAADYAVAVPEFESALPKLLLPVASDLRAKIVVHRSAGPTDYEDPFDLSLDLSIVAMFLRHPVYFYSVSVSSGANTELDLGHFVYVDGGFRLLGRILATRVDSGVNVRLLPPSAKMERVKLLESKHPAYPGVALSRHMQGTVRILATIGSDGSIKDPQVLQGESVFVDPTLVAIRQWRYTPPLLDNKPIELATLITMIFSFQQ